MLQQSQPIVSTNRMLQHAGRAASTFNAFNASLGRGPVHMKKNILVSHMYADQDKGKRPL